MRKSFKSIMLHSVFVAAHGWLLAGPADAQLTLRFSTGSGANTTIIDNGVADFDPAVDAILTPPPSPLPQFTGFITASAIMNSTQAVLTTTADLTRSNVAGLDTITFEASRTGFVLSSSSFLLGSSTSGTFISVPSGTGGYTLQSYADQANALFGQTMTTGLQGPLNSTGLAANSFLDIANPQNGNVLFPFSLSHTASVTLSPSPAQVMATQSNRTTATVPEPATAGVTAAACLLMVSRRAGPPPRSRDGKGEGRKR